MLPPARNLYLLNSKHRQLAQICGTTTTGTQPDIIEVDGKLLATTPLNWTISRRPLPPAERTLTPTTSSMTRPIDVCG